MERTMPGQVRSISESSYSAVPVLDPSFVLQSRSSVVTPESIEGLRYSGSMTSSIPILRAGVCIDPPEDPLCPERLRGRPRYLHVGRDKPSSNTDHNPTFNHSPSSHSSANTTCGEAPRQAELGVNSESGTAKLEIKRFIGRPHIPSKPATHLQGQSKPAALASANSAIMAVESSRTYAQSAVAGFPPMQEGKKRIPSFPKEPLPIPSPQEHKLWAASARNTRPQQLPRSISTPTLNTFAGDRRGPPPPLAVRTTTLIRDWSPAPDKHLHQTNGQQFFDQQDLHQNHQALFTAVNPGHLNEAVDILDFDLPPPPSLNSSPTSAQGRGGRQSRSTSRPPSRMSMATRKLMNKLRKSGSSSSRQGSPSRSGSETPPPGPSRSDSHSSLSTLSSRLGSIMSLSRPQSRAQSRSGSPARSPMSHTSTDDDSWPEYIPRRGPSTEVQEDLAPLTYTTHTLIDIDHGARHAFQPLASTNLTAVELTEAKQQGISGIYFSGTPGVGSAGGDGWTDEEGQYKWVAGDHIGYRYQVEELLGKGCFGIVLKCRDFKSGRMVAVKVTVAKPDLKAQARVEAAMLRTLATRPQQPRMQQTRSTSVSPVREPELEKHHLIRHLNDFTFRGHVCIVTEILGPSLYDILKRNDHKGLSEPTVRYITRQILEALEYLGEKNILHCDLKPENVLMSDIDRCQIKLIDFGSSCYESRRMYTYIQSRFYRAPEILLGMTYGPSIDMWSLGCMVPELLLGKPLWPSVTESDQVALICESLGAPGHDVLQQCSRAGAFFDINRDLLRPEPPQKTPQRGPAGSRPLASLLSPCAADFCNNILRWMPSDRMSATDAIFHDFCLGI